MTELQKPDLRLLDRGFKLYQESLSFDLKEIPNGKTILNSGSGTFQRFERELKLLRPDITIISLDLSYATKKVEHISYARVPLPEDLHTILNDDERQRFKTAYEKGICYPKFIDTIRRKYPFGNVVASHALNLPFADNSFWNVFDLYGPAYYFQENEAKCATSYLRELARVMELGGSAYIAPTTFGNNNSINYVLKLKKSPKFEINASGDRIKEKLQFCQDIINFIPEISSMPFVISLNKTDSLW
ncbi:hypothetical protein HGB07_01730 [Candidatus Roizmanbacteria bacterium]|nr:hypothetical protein [Candidatus Roizmanbacteria bacterium]